MITIAKEELRRALRILHTYLAKDNAYDWLTVSVTEEYGIVMYAIGSVMQALAMGTMVQCEGEIKELGAFTIGTELDALVAQMPEGDVHLSVLRNQNNEPTTLRIEGANRFKARLQVHARESTIALLSPFMGKMDNFQTGFESIVPKDELTNLVRLSKLFGNNPNGNAQWIILDAREDGMFGRTQETETGALEEFQLTAQYNGIANVAVRTDVMIRALSLCRASVQIRGGLTRKDGTLFSDPEDSRWRTFAAQTLLPGEK